MPPKSGRRKKRTLRIKLRRGTLSQFGYNTGLAVGERHAALKRASLKVGSTVVLRKLNVVAMLNSKRSPITAAKLRADSAWVKQARSGFRAALYTFRARPKRKLGIVVVDEPRPKKKKRTPAQQRRHKAHMARKRRRDAQMRRALMAPLPQSAQRTPLVVPLPYSRRKPVAAKNRGKIRPGVVLVGTSGAFSAFRPMSFV